MDAFDPAALLPELSDVFGSLTTVCRFAVMIGPVILLALGLAYLFFSPKEANYYFGFRCYYGMGSVQAWRFTQRLAGLLYSVLGLALTLIMLLISSGFDKLEVTDMVWRAADCLIWQAVLVLAATVTIHVSAAMRYDRRGLRRQGKNRRPCSPEIQPQEEVEPFFAEKNKKGSGFSAWRNLGLTNPAQLHTMMAHPV